MLVDRARVRVIAGSGGHGCVSFRREKFVPKGGPDGGDGGDGGDVFFKADPRFHSLMDVQMHAVWRGDSGVNGQGSNCHGKAGRATYIHVPAGTQIKDFHTDELLADLVEPGDEYLAARGGRGGRGNARFTSSTRRAPKFAERGEPGEEQEFRLELKLIAEVGLVGLPNAGKSTFLAAATAAKPKIADYPFTTLSPNLGVAHLSDYRTLTLADIPGIIEGAADGKGLGHDFLRHIERNRVLLFLIDLGDADPLETRGVLEAELAQHSPELAEKPRVFALNKADIAENRTRFEDIKGRFDTPHLISAATGEGVPELLARLWTMVDDARRAESEQVYVVPEKTYTYEPPFTVEKSYRGFEVRGTAIERVVNMTEFENEEALHHFQSRLKRMGVFKALKRMGARQGDAIYIGDEALVYEPDRD